MHQFARFGMQAQCNLPKRIVSQDYRIEHRQQMSVSVEDLHILLSTVFTTHFNYFSRSRDFIS